MDDFNAIFAPATRRVHLKVLPNGDYGIAASAGKGVLTVEGVPNATPPEAVILRLNGITLWGDIPDRIEWSIVKGLERGKILRCRKDEVRGCVTADLQHWTGECSIGGYWGVS